MSTPVFVQRDGPRIVGVFGVPQTGVATEPVSASDPQVVAFRASMGLPAAIAEYQRWSSLDAAREAMTEAVSAEAARRRVALTGTVDPTLLAVRREQHDIAAIALADTEASAMALASLEPEAAARGYSATAFAQVLIAQADAWRAGSLAIEAAAARHRAAIAALTSIAAVSAHDPSTGWPE
jgi:hypothetical protein